MDSADRQHEPQNERKGESSGHVLYYFIMRGYDEFHDADEWIGIYHDKNAAKEAYYHALEELKAEHQKYCIPGDHSSEYTRTHENVWVNIFDETESKWRYMANPEKIFL